MEGGLAQGLGQKDSTALEVFDTVQRPEAGQRLSLMRSVLILIWSHSYAAHSARGSHAGDFNGVWDCPCAGPAGGRAASTSKQSASAGAVDQGSKQR